MGKKKNTPTKHNYVLNHNTMRHKETIKTNLTDKKRFYDFLATLKDQTRCNLLEYLDETYINWICEAFFNCVYIDHGIPTTKLNKIRKLFSNCKPDIKKICDYKTKTCTKRHLLRQRGGFIGTLLSAILPVIAGLITPLLNKK